MKTVLFTKGLEELKTEALVIGFFEGVDTEDVEKYTNVSDGLLSEVIREKDFNGKFGKILMLRLKAHIKRFVLIGLGKKEEFNINKAREAAGKAAVYVRDQGIKEFSFSLFDDLKPFDAAYSCVEGVRLALYQFIDFKTQGLDEIKKVEHFTVVAGGNNFVDVDEGIRKALVVTDSVCYVRDLQNRPSNVVTPTYLAEEAKNIASKFKLKCTILEKKQMEKLGMGGILAVNRGSSHPAKFIILEYEGGKETVCFVGKGITFDSGGISLKPPADMGDMKFDMSGGAVVFGIVQAAARLKLPYRVIGLVPATENLPGGNAYKPGDIIKLHNGKTVEVIDTDAEGRLVLGDALSYSKRFNPNFVVDFATLTGACVVSLGSVYAGMFSNSDELARKLFEAGDKISECVWRMPLHDKYKEYMKSSVADIKNWAPKEAGAITASVFLKEFVDCKYWAHLDIAGTAYTKNSDGPLRSQGGTGYGVRLALQLLEDWKKN